MATIIRGPCPTCGGTMAKEVDVQAIRLFCVNCGHDEWIKVSPAPVAVGQRVDRRRRIRLGVAA